MARSPIARAGLCALYLACVACGSDPEPTGGSSGAGQSHTAGSAGSATAGSASSSGGAGPVAGSAGSAISGLGGTTGGAGAAGDAEPPSGGERGGPPPAVDGRSVYEFECHGDSKDCHRGTVPCFGVSSSTPNVAEGWACANRCASDADCSNAPTSTEARAACVPFALTGHCMLVCQNENLTAACPDGMDCYVPPRSPIGYCLWR